MVLRSIARGIETVRDEGILMDQGQLRIARSVAKEKSHRRSLGIVRRQSQSEISFGCKKGQEHLVPRGKGWYLIAHTIGRILQTARYTPN